MPVKIFKNRFRIKKTVPYTFVNMVKANNKLIKFMLEHNEKLISLYINDNHVIITKTLGKLSDGTMFNLLDMATTRNLIKHLFPISEIVENIVKCISLVKTEEVIDFNLLRDVKLLTGETEIKDLYEFLFIKDETK